ncbi:MAG TPA: hypothetical protein ENJ33_05565 [Thiothrix sp.]|nr:hypothetical protein [Thiothrix sp.]
MKTTQKTALSFSIAAMLILPLSIASASHSSTMTVKITNISNVVFTPPIVALCKKRIQPIAKVGSPASNELEPLAEGGDTSALANIFDYNACNYVTSATPIPPGESITLELTGRRQHYLHMASMLLPTNDGFIYSSGHKVKHIKKQGGLALRSYDAGTEFNDELCANIPGPQCGGEGFNATREDNNFIKPHPGIQGAADVSAATYNWGEPVAYIEIN